MLKKNKFHQRNQIREWRNYMRFNNTKHLQVIIFLISLLLSSSSCVLVKPEFSPEKIAHLPQDMYDPKGAEVSEKNFKKTIANASAGGKYIWVMMDRDHQSMICTGDRENFWLTLKENYNEQVSGFIRLNIENWSNNRQTAKDFVGKAGIGRDDGKNQWPMYMLFKDGKVINGESYTNDVRIRCPPKDNPSKYEFLRYIERNSGLKRKQ